MVVLGVKDYLFFLKICYNGATKERGNEHEEI